MGINHWVITRPKRKLILVPELLKIFYSIASGEKWERNRSIQLKYEKALKESEWKAQNVSKDASGARTYAALLFMLGLWYESKDGVNLTLAGNEIINDMSAVEVLTKQLLDMQFPSAYSKKRTVNVSDSFHVQPYRFILNLFLNKEFTEITQDEIGFCLVPFAKRNSNLDECAELIREFREKPERIIKKAVEISETSSDNLRNIGNTAVNQFLITGFFNEGDETKSLILTQDGKQKSVSFLKKLRKNLISYNGDDVEFQKRYGTGIFKTKDYSDSHRGELYISPNKKKILQQFYMISSKQPIYEYSDDLVGIIKLSSGESEEAIRDVLKVFPLETQVADFEKIYQNISVGGKEFATEFEKKTSSLFLDGFGLDAEWVGSKPRHPDIFVFLDHKNLRHGIIDTKAYKEYSLPLDQKNKMANIYIPKFREITHNKKIYRLAFFGYIAGGYTNSMSSSFNELISWVDVPGHYITAKNFLLLLRAQRKNPYSVDELMILFSLNQELTSNEFIRR